MSGLISVEEALQLLAAHPRDDREEHAGLADALGRVLNQPLLARTTVPPADVSSMDGYAVRLEDVRTAGNTLRLVGEIPAGTIPAIAIGPGETMRIFTGATLPEGADHILIQEEAEQADGQVTVTEAQETGRHIRKAGLDFSEGDLLVPEGTLLGAPELAIAAASNHAELPVRRRLKVAIIPGGDELRPPGSTLRPGQIIESNSTALAALVRGWGGEPVTAGIAGDSIEAIRSHIEAASEADILVPVGGASVGDYDYMKAAFDEAGAEIVFSKVAVKPGKPTWFARLGRQRVLGLPGNPASAYVCAHLFLRPLLTGGSGLKRLYPAHLGVDLPANGPRETFLRATSRTTESGTTVEPLPAQDSSLLRPFLTANCLVRRLAGAPPAKAGDRIDCLPLSTPAGQDFPPASA